MSPKKVSHRDITGDRGIALIHSIVGAMGFVWNPTGLEAGIDGYIEIRDSKTGEMTNFIIQVQSKATEKDFQAENVDGFDYYCDSRDIDYWLGGNAPVILIRSRPTTNEAYWVSIKDYFKDLSKRSTNKVHFDKKENKFDEHCREALVGLAKPNESGIYLAPLPTKEKLVSNLLPVKSFGEKIYIAETNYRSVKTLRDKLQSVAKNTGKEWILKNKQIMSFHDLNEFPWTEMELGAVEGFFTDEWALSDEIEKKNDFITLLNLSLSQKLYPNVRFEKDQGYYYFAPTNNLSPRKISYKGLIQNTSRVVFQDYRKKKDNNQISHYRHSAFFGKFLRFDNIWYLEITPTYHFTSDGYRIFTYREDQLKGIKQLERNPAVLGQVIMWADYLQEKPDLFSRTSQKFIEFGLLENFEIHTGLDDKTWLKKEENEEAETANSKENQLPLFK